MEKNMYEMPHTQVANDATTTPHQASGESCLLYATYTTANMIKRTQPMYKPKLAALRVRGIMIKKGQRDAAEAPCLCL
jgi:hypothetical protein